jgi:uracil-DNA glycosylase family 4
MAWLKACLPDRQAAPSHPYGIGWLHYNRNRSSRFFSIQDRGLRKLEELNQEVIQCRKCPRLVRFREKIADEKRRAFREWEYWGKPVPGFGDPHAKLLILGLAPAAHGANRTGRMFTGDRSGDFLYKALYETGFASQPASTHGGDGLKLKDVYISATLRCAPPANKPLPSELANCRPYFESELALIRPRAILALGSIAMRAYLDLLKQEGKIKSLAAFPFGHGVSYKLSGDLPRLFASYHPSQQNTFTGKLTEPMMIHVFLAIRKFLKNDSGE